MKPTENTFSFLFSRMRSRAPTGIEKVEKLEFGLLSLQVQDQLWQLCRLGVGCLDLPRISPRAVPQWQKSFLPLLIRAGLTRCRLPKQPAKPARQSFDLFDIFDRRVSANGIREGGLKNSPPTPLDRAPIFLRGAA